MLRRCPSCSTVNRIPAARLHQTARCGRCKTAMPPPDTPVDIVDVTTFDELTRGSLPVLVDFWATWCGPCRTVAPEVARAAADLAGRALVVKVEIDRLPELAQRFAIRSVPSFIVVRSGTPVLQRVGALGHRDLERMVEAQAA